MSNRVDHTSRSLARLGAVQALYQMDIAGSDLERVLAEFASLYLGKGPDGEIIGEADENHFRALVSGAVENQSEIDPKIDKQLAEGWRLDRLDSTLRAILRIGTFELGWCLDVPVNVVLDEYIELSHDFFDGDEDKVVNGVLDALAKTLRASELSA